MKKVIKTNAMRILDGIDIEYEHIDYNLEGDFISSVDLSKKSEVDLHYMYKTLATLANTGEIYIFVIPADRILNFKKAAKAIGVKNLEMLALKDLKPKVGYERGATTCLAMKKDFVVTIDQSALDLETIKVSAGKVGHGLKLNPRDLAKASGAKFYDVVQ